MGNYLCSVCGSSFTFSHQDAKIVYCASCGGLLIEQVTNESLKEKRLEATQEKSHEIPEIVKNALNEPKNIFGKFVVIKELGFGVRTDVFLAWDRVNARYVALKLVSIGKDEALRFERETRRASKLEQPNIARIYEVGSINGKYYVAMQYIDGKSLEKIELDQRRSLEIMRDAAFAIDYAHSQGVLHLDIKPHNIMVDTKGKTVVIGFGMANVLETHSDYSSGKVVLGTPGFMSPEQAKGLIDQLDQKTDVYGLGATLYYLVTGRAPFSASNTARLLKSTAKEQAIMPSMLNPNIPKHVENIIIKAMEQKNKHRYQTAKELAKDIERSLRGEIVSAKGISFIRRVTGTLRNPAVIAAVILLFITISWQVYVHTNTFFEKIQSSAKQQELKNRALEIVYRSEMLYTGIKHEYTKKDASLEKLFEKLLSLRSQLGESIKIQRTASAHCNLARINADLCDFERAYADLSWAMKLDTTLDLCNILQIKITFDELALGMYILDVTGEDKKIDKNKLRQALLNLKKINMQKITDLPTVETDIALSLRYYAEENYEDANLRLKDGFERHKSEEYAWTRAALIVDTEKKYDNALELLTTSLSFKYHFAKGLLARGYLRVMTNDLRGASEDFDHALLINPIFAAAYNNRGYVHLLRKDFERAIKDFTMALRLDPANPLFYLNRAQAKNLKCDFEGAINDYNEAIKSDHKSYACYFQLGSCYINTAQTQKAIENFDLAIELRQDAPEAYIERSKAHEKVGSIDSAIDDLEKALNLKKDSPDIYYNLGLLHKQKGDNVQALNYLNHVIELDKNNASAYYHRGLVHLDMNIYDKALADFETCSRLNASYKSLVKEHIERCKRDSK